MATKDAAATTRASDEAGAEREPSSRAGPAPDGTNPNGPGAPAGDAPPQNSPPDEGFRVDQPGFAGTLGELAHALRTGALAPFELDLYRLVRDYLIWFRRYADADPVRASEAMPKVAQAIELKTRLLLPRPPRAPEDDEEGSEDLEEALGAIALLEEMEEAIDFLRVRREERTFVLPARAPRPPYPRPERPIAVAIERLAEMASRYRPTSYFELAIERMTMSGAMDRLRTRLRELRRGLLGDLSGAGDWATRAIHFAGMLELVKEGTVIARQEEAYGEIELEWTEEGGEEAEVA